MKSSRQVYFLLFLFCTCFFGTADAQNNASVRCVVFDSHTLRPVAFANAVLTDIKTNTIVRRLQADSGGVILMGNLPTGLFRLFISYTGYQQVVKDSIWVTTLAGIVDIGQVKMEYSRSSLKEVTVIAAPHGNQTGISKKKFLVEQSLVSKGGTATDLLQNIPTITIDGSGNVSLRGSQRVNILIDGKPSLIAGGDIVQTLQSLPANAIESVELVTNPSSKYDAEGESGIINIILKKNKQAGFKGTANATAGTRDNYSGGSSLSFQNSKVNMYIGYDYQHSNTFSNGYQNIQYLSPSNAVAFSNEQFPSTTVNDLHNLKGSVDYYITPKNQLSFSGGFNASATAKQEFLHIDQLDNNKVSLQVINTTNSTSGYGNTYNANLDFVRIFRKPKEELAVSIGYSHGINNSVQHFTEYTDSVDEPLNKPDTSILHPFTHNHNSYYNLQADYSLPIGTATIQVGYRSQVRLDSRSQLVYNYNAHTGDYDEYYPFSAYFHGNNQVHALYINYQDQVKNFGYQLGLRGEDAELSGYVLGYDATNAALNIPVKVSNKRLFPSVTLTQKMDGNQLLQFSYSRRVSRPSPRNYSPIPDVSDPVNYDVGNPNILPQDIHAFEFGYNKAQGRLNFTASLYYRITNDFIAHIESMPVNGVITTTSENLASAQNGGLEIITRITATNAWNFIVNANLYETQTSAAAKYGIAQSSGFSWNMNLTNNFSITKKISLQVRGDYHTPGVSAQDRNRSSFSADAAVKINLFNNRSVLTINGRDIFATRRWGFLRAGNDVLLDFERKTVAARASLSFAYTFGKIVLHAKNVEHSTEKQEQ